MCAATLLLFFSIRAEAAVSFNRDVRPILSENCFACHGPDAEDRQADLRLDVRDAAVASRAIVPNEPAQSSVVNRIFSRDETELMPPPDSHKKLSASQKEILKQWIAEGASYEVHWSLAPIRRPPLPAVRNIAWARNAIDRFVLARLERESLQPAAPAAPGTLLRRVTFDLTGLPPTEEEAIAFASQHDDAGYQVVVDRLLHSTQYGEHWARHWMDLVRYADSAGYETDNLYTHSWKFRDWIIRSLASNKPINRFIEEQIAGDELWPDNLDAAAGALYLTIGPMRIEGGIQREKERTNDWLTDLADTTGAAFLGLTFGCVRCHDHKFDPLTQVDYYGLQAIFADSTLQSDISDEDVRKSRPTAFRAVVLEQPADVHILRRGELDLPQDEAHARLPAVLPGGGPIPDEKLRRADLARWLTDADNPLTARVFVNRVWQWHFGIGLVQTANDFGSQGEPPSHPELLDWLAAELIDSGWDMQHVHRLILDCATYRQSSTASPDSQLRDPNRRLLSAFPRRRLQAEELRDAMLSVSGVLNLKSYGKPVVPPVEPWALATLRHQNWYPTKDPQQLRRRSVYFVVRRSIKLPLFDAFNIPDNTTSCAARDNTIVASQALALLNSQDTLEHARSLADRLWRESRGDTAQAAARAWRLLFAREITAEESARAVAFVDDRKTAWAHRADEADAALPEPAADPLRTAANYGAWTEWCLALLNSNEFIYVD